MGQLWCCTRYRSINHSGAGHARPVPNIPHSLYANLLPATNTEQNIYHNPKTLLLNAPTLSRYKGDSTMTMPNLEEIFYRFDFTDEVPPQLEEAQSEAAESKSSSLKNTAFRLKNAMILKLRTATRY